MSYQEYDKNHEEIVPFYDADGCYFSEEKWVHPSDPSEETDYKEGCFKRAYCLHDGRWCFAVLGYKECQIYDDHDKE